ncbi:MAG: flavin reductase [Novosphingobium sp.]
MGNADERVNFRQALSAFPTGVTIVTTLDAEGVPVGVTASSFNSVSLDPPLVLWSLAKSSKSHDAFCNSGHFAIHVLAAHQEDLSNRFSRAGADKFADVTWRSGASGAPVLDHYAALFDCTTRYLYEGGDHVILVGEVVAFEKMDAAPLVFHGGRYAEARSRPSNQDPAPGVDLEAGSFSDDFLLYLVSRAHFQSSLPTRRKLEQLGLSQTEYMVLALLSMQSPMPATDIKAQLDHTGLSPSTEALDAMVESGLLQMERQDIELAGRGREAFLETLAVAKAFEEDITVRFTPGEVAEAKQFLRKLIDVTGTGVPIAWR